MKGVVQGSCFSSYRIRMRVGFAFLVAVPASNGWI